jgi:protein-disulfide isomerase
MHGPNRQTTTLLRVMFLAAIAAPTATATTGPKPLPPRAAEPLAARVNGRPIPAAELDRFVATQIYRLKEAEYQARLQGLRQLVMPSVIEDEATARGITVDALMKQEVADKVPDPAPAEIQAVMGFMKDKLPADPAQAHAAVRANIRSQREQGRREAFQAELWRKAKVEILLEPPRVLLPSSPGDPTRGPMLAAVTIVEFGDFECTQCASVGGAIAELEAKHPGLLRVVFKQMPLNIHEHARGAASMALCAADQGKFWELHDWLFAHQTTLGQDAILAAARGLGIDAEALRICAESGAHDEDIDRDVAITRQIGVNSTPLLLVNGRVLVGEAAILQLADVVEDELRRAGRLAPSPVQ